MKKMITNTIILYTVVGILLNIVLFYVINFSSWFSFAYGFVFFTINSILILLVGYLLVSNLKTDQKGSSRIKKFLKGFSLVVFKITFIGGGLYYGVVVKDLNLILLVLGASSSLGLMTCLSYFLKDRYLGEAVS